MNDSKRSRVIGTTRRASKNAGKSDVHDISGNSNRGRISYRFLFGALSRRIFAMYGMLVGLWLILGVGFYWQYFDYIIGGKPFVLLSSPEILNTLGQPQKVFYPGEEVIIQWKGVQTRDCPVVFERFLRDGTVYFLGTHGTPSVDYNNIDTVRIVFVLPRRIPNGMWIFYMKATFTCNPLTDFTYRFPSIPIKIDASASSGS